MNKYVTFVRKRKNDDQTDETAPKILPKINIAPNNYYSTASLLIREKRYNLSSWIFH